MMKIMIVDDTPVFREHLRRSIDWGTYGFTVCCEAKDGREALALYEQHQPDIVLADIAMPHMDGLEMSRAMLSGENQPAIVLITSSSEFESAQQAIKLGVHDYIVKPFEKQALIVTLLKLQDNINRALEMRSEREELRRMRHMHRLRQLVYNQNPGGHLPSESQDLFSHPYFLVAAARVDLHENWMNPDEVLKWQEMLVSLLRTAIQIDGSVEVFHDLEGNIVTIMNFGSRQAMEGYDSSEFWEISKLAKDSIGFAMAVGISGFCEGAEFLGAAYHQSVQALSHFYVERQPAVFDYKALAPGKATFYSQSLVDGINQALEVLDYPRIEALIVGELDAIREYENPEYAIMIYMSLLSVLFSFLVRRGRSISAVFGEGFRPYSAISQVPSHTEKRALVCECYRKAIDYQLANREARSTQTAQRTRQYIEENYQNPRLVVDDIARKLLVNQTYLRSMFKKEYGTTISDYITKCRMEKAKELARQPGFKLAAVAEAVGYNDTSYFSKCFKKYFGYSPSDIRNQA